MLKKLLYGTLAVLGLILASALIFDAPICRDATAQELDAVAGSLDLYEGANPTRGWVYEGDGHDLIAVALEGEVAVFGTGSVDGMTFSAAVNDVARSVSQQGADIAADSPAAQAVGMDDASGIDEAQRCAEASA